MTDELDDSNSQYYIELGARIKKFREAKGVTQSRLSETIGVNRTSVANIEAGRQRLFAHSIVSIASVLGVTPAELLGVAGGDGADIAYGVEFRETIRDCDGGISTWSKTSDLDRLMTSMATKAEYAPVAEVRTVTTIYGDWQRISLSNPLKNGEQQ